jgi:hypothetical protein
MQLHRLGRGVMIACMVAFAGARADADGDDKSPALATGLALGGTLAGAGLLAAGFSSSEAGTPLHDQFALLMVSGSALLVFGPSLGNWYAHQGWSTGLAMRLGGGLAMGVGGSLIAAGLFRSAATSGAGLGIGLAGAGLLVTGVGFDLWEAHRAVDGYNRRRAAPRIAVAPMLARAGGAQRTGLAVVASF